MLLYFVLYTIGTISLSILMPINISIANRQYDTACTNALYSRFDMNISEPPGSDMTPVIVISVILFVVQVIFYIIGYVSITYRCNKPGGMFMMLAIVCIPLLWLIYMQGYNVYRECTDNFDIVVMLIVAPVIVVAGPNIVIWLCVDLLYVWSKLTGKDRPLLEPQCGDIFA